MDNRTDDRACVGRSDSAHGALSDPLGPHMAGCRLSDPLGLWKENKRDIMYDDNDYISENITIIYTR